MIFVPSGDILFRMGGSILVVRHRFGVHSFVSCIVSVLHGTNKKLWSHPLAVPVEVRIAKRVLSIQGDDAL
jgi:hypothetical protein